MIVDDKSCCCQLGDNCICGLKKATDLRVDTTLSKPSHTRPSLVKGNSESHVTTYINEHHKACHKLKHSTHAAGMPYPYSKKHGGSSTSNTPNSMESQGQFGQIMSIPHRGSKDDSALLSPSAGFYSTSPPAQVSVDNLPLSSFSSGSLFNSQGYQFPTSTPVDSQDQLPFSPNESCSEQFLNELMSANSQPSPAEELLSQLQSNSDMYQSQEDLFGADHPSFSPADLPLTSTPFATNFPQPTSFSDESNAQSAPGLTATSSTTHSELGDASTLLDNIFDQSSITIPNYDIQDITNFSSGSPTLQKPMQAPTSEPAPNRRSFDADTMRSLSTFPAFNDSLLSNSVGVDPIASSASSFVGSFPGPSGLPFVPPPTSEPSSNPLVFRPQPAPISFDSPSSGDRPRSMPIPITGAYNPNTAINAMYPDLDQQFASAASWDPSAGLDISSGNWQFPLQ